MSAMYNDVILFQSIHGVKPMSSRCELKKGNKCVCNCVAFIIFNITVLSPQIEVVYSVAIQHVLLYKLVQYIIDMYFFSV
ncbi:hypothetical protein FKM82_007101 [Ascaphus truei]